MNSQTCTCIEKLLNLLRPSACRARNDVPGNGLDLAELRGRPGSPPWGMSFPLRSPRDTVGGIMVFGRILDKIRLDAEGRLPPGYHVGIIAGSRTFDDRVCKLLGISFDALRARVLEGGSDEDVLEWCFAHGRKPDPEHVEIFNGFMTKRGWRDAASAGLEKQKQEAGLGHREDIVTFFELMDAEEGRA